MPARVLNATKGTILAESAGIAKNAAARNKGLLDRISLGKAEGLWIIPCSAVHTLGMRFPIDVVFLDKAGRILQINQINPEEFGQCEEAYSVIELSAGRAGATNAQVGDQLKFLAI